MTKQENGSNVANENKLFEEIDKALAGNANSLAIIPIDSAFDEAKKEKKRLDNVNLPLAVSSGIATTISLGAVATDTLILAGMLTLPLTIASPILFAALAVFAAIAVVSMVSLAYAVDTPGVRDRVDNAADKFKNLLRSQEPGRVGDYGLAQ